MPEVVKNAPVKGAFRSYCLIQSSVQYFILTQHILTNLIRVPV